MLFYAQNKWKQVGQKGPRLRLQLVATLSPTPVRTNSPTQAHNNVTQGYNKLELTLVALGLQLVTITLTVDLESEAYLNVGVILQIPRQRSERANAALKIIALVCPP